MNCRELQCGKCFITQKYKVLTHKGIDMVADINGEHATDYVVAHSDGVVVWVQKGQKNNPKSSGNASYGNCVKLKHADGYYTLYAHLKNVSVKLNQKVKKGEVLGYMGNTGRSFGAHLHWEVRNTKDTRINPTDYINADLPSVKKEYQTYDNVKKKWLPKIKVGSKDYAGNFKNPIGGFRMSQYTYKAYDMAKKAWLPAVTGMSDYAGNLGNNIGAIAINGNNKLKYRVHLKNSNRWLGWVTGYNTKDFTNGYAGNLDEPIDAIQIDNK